MAVLRRFDCLLEDTKEKVVEKAKTTDIEMILKQYYGSGVRAFPINPIFNLRKEKNIVLGNSFTADGHRNEKVRFALMNPPFGVDWKKD